MKKVYIWGTGRYGQILYLPVIQNGYDVVGYIDSDSRLWGKCINGVEVVSLDEAIKNQPDCIMFAIWTPGAYDEVLKQIEDRKFDKEKFIDILSDPEYQSISTDVRINFIHGFSRYIYDNSIDGAVAECGVYRGDTSKFINFFFKDRELYLFDTFEGFSESDVDYERKLNDEMFVSGQFNNTNVFNNTAVEYVMEKMPFRENIHVKKGYFPDTTKNMKQITFCFVNLDMDLYVPMLEGLRYFWDKMVEGGCILLHDYYHKSLPGVKRAVDDFENEIGIRLIKTPIGDGCSIAILK